MPRRKKTPPEERPPELAEAEVNREIAEDFAERQDFNQEGSDQLAKKLRNHTSLSPELSAGDVDAAWDYGRESGEETLGGHAPTPDQDRVDDIGAAAGLTYKDDEPLQYGKVARRDERRWELEGRGDQAAEEADDEEEPDEDDQADDDKAPLRFWDLADDLDAEVEEEYDDEEDDEDEDEEDEGGGLAEDEDLDADAEEAEDEDDYDSDDEALEEDELESDLDDEGLDDLDDDEDDYDDDDDDDEDDD